MQAMQIDTDKLAQQCIDEIGKRVKNLKTLNIMVVGKSGVGKSTLINSLFRGNFAETGLGRSVTAEIRKLEKNGYPLAIYDTPGFELSLDQQKKVKDEIIEIIREGVASNDINQMVHCIWYCINVAANRTFDESEIQWLKEFTADNQCTHIPVIVVLTQAVPKKKAEEMKYLVEKENLDIVKVVPVLAQDMEFDEEYIARAYGLDRLIEIMVELLPPELQDTLQNVQKASLQAKKKASQKVIATAVATSFGTGFAPIPFSDAAFLVPTQVGMIAGITVIFGMDISKSFLTSFVSATIGGAGATVLGRTIVSNLLKMIPGIGTGVGGMISGGTAGLLTTALGEAYLLIMEMIYKGEIKKEDIYTDKGKNIMSKLFKEELKKNRQKEIGGR